MNKTNGITLDDLAGMVARGFAQVDIRFKEFDSRFVALEEKMDVRFEKVERKIEELEQRMNSGFTSLQNQLDSARLAYTPRREHLHLVDRVKRVERKVGITPKLA
jgi:hypothetical protein